MNTNILIDKFFGKYVYHYIGLITFVHIAIAYTVGYDLACIFLCSLFMAGLVIYHISIIKASKADDSNPDDNSGIRSVILYAGMLVCTIFAPQLFAGFIYLLTAIFLYMRRGIESGKIL